MNEKNENSRVRNWFLGLRDEFRKIVWPDRASLGRQTVAVIIVSVILAIIIAILDFGIQYGIDLLTSI